MIIFVAFKDKLLTYVTLTMQGKKLFSNRSSTIEGSLKC
jgi:hypothetical protein